jgi:hypothetical protein
MPAYLESSNPANTALYQRFGFERLGVTRVGHSPTHGPHAAHRTMIDVEGWVQRKTQLLAQYSCRLKPLLLCPCSGSGFF